VGIEIVRYEVDRRLIVGQSLIQTTHVAERDGDVAMRFCVVGIELQSMLIGLDRVGVVTHLRQRRAQVAVSFSRVWHQLNEPAEGG
jgi:hypothetical protein